MRILKQKGKSMIGLNAKNDGMYDAEIKVKIPIGTELKGEPMVLLPLSNGQLQISIPQASIPLAMGMMADCLAVLAQMQFRNDQAKKQDESRIVQPGPMVPSFLPH